MDLEASYYYKHGKFKQIAWIFGDDPVFELTTKDTKYTKKYKPEEIFLYQQAFSFVLFVSFVVPSI